MGVGPFTTAETFPPLGDIFNRRTFREHVFRQIRALWRRPSARARIKTPIGGEFAIDDGYRLIRRNSNSTAKRPNAVYILRREQLHFRFRRRFKVKIEK